MGDAQTCVHAPPWNSVLTGHRKSEVAGASPAVPGAGAGAGLADVSGAQPAAAKEGAAKAQGASAVAPEHAAKVRVGVAEDRNTRWRRTMEDTHIYMPEFGGVRGQTLLAVFDGHAGRFAAEWCQEHFHEHLAQVMHEYPNMPIPEVLNQTYLRVDDHLEDASQKSDTRSGCTAVTVLLRSERGPENDEMRRMLYTANVGDARAVLCRGGRALRLSYDHKGSDPQEHRRISEKGGFLLKNRVTGVLAVTRSLGDFSMKEFIIGAPYTTALELQSADEFLIVACDGLWDVLDDQAAVDLVRGVADPAAAAQTLMSHALGNFCTDNITVMVVRLPADEA